MMQRWDFYREKVREEKDKLRKQLEKE